MRPRIKYRKINYKREVAVLIKVLENIKNFNIKTGVSKEKIETTVTVN